MMKFNIGLYIVILFSILVSYVSFLDYNPKLVTGFGYTNIFINISQTSLSEGYYSRTLVSDEFPEKKKIIAEVQREPLYPSVLMFVKSLTGQYENILFIQFALFVTSIMLISFMVYKRYGIFITIITQIGVLFSPMIGFYFSVMYPYAFQFLFSLLFILFFLEIQSSSSKKAYYSSVFSGVFLGLVIYERGSLLLFPFFLFLFFVLYRFIILLLSKYLNFFSKNRKYKLVSFKHMIMLVCVTYLTVLPWIYRNNEYDTSGMNQMIGYSMGYTYGRFPLAETNLTEKYYHTLVNKYGVDRGSVEFISALTLNETGTFSENDKVLLNIAIKKVSNNREHFVKLQKENVKLFVSDISNPDVFFYKVQAEEESSPWSYWKIFARKKLPSTLDQIIIVLAFCGLIIGMKKGDLLAYLTFALFFYLLFTLLIVLFSARYRGVLDILLFVYTGVMIKETYSYIKGKIIRSPVVHS